MAECRCKKWFQGVAGLRPDTLVILLLAAWGVLNLLQAALTGLADDEAYYWYFSQHLDWGYFDHPPMVALLVRLSSWLPGLLGIRFFSTLLQPLYLWLFWRLMRSADASRSDAVLYLLLCFAQPLLQLYGFLAVPDAPLMASTALFLWAFRRFYRNNSLPSALLLGLSVALLGYSKYHGALVVALVVLANPRLLLRPRLYLAALTALVLMLPHFWWQYTHDWVSLRYHLMGRNAWEYRFSFTGEYLLTLLVIFNPLLLWHFVRGLRQRPAEAEARAAHRTAVVLFFGFACFFLLSTLRGRVQPQWLLPAVFPFVAITFRGARDSRYVRVVGMVSLGLFLVVRILAVANPFHLKGQLWEGDEPYRKVAALADGRPVQFVRCYAFAAKYAYYTGNPTHCSSLYYDRESQWMFDTVDRTFTGQEVIVSNLGDLRGDTLYTEAPRNVKYQVVPDFHPMRELRVTPLESLDLRLPLLARADTTKPADSIPPFVLPLEVANPYPYDICSDSLHPVVVRLIFQYDERHCLGASTTLTDTLRAGEVMRISPSLRLPATLPDGDLSSGLTIGYSRYPSALNGHRYTSHVNRTSDSIYVRIDW